MTQDPLYQALGTRAVHRPARGLRRGWAVGLLACAVAAGALALVLVGRHPRPASGGVAVATIEVAPKPPPAPPLPATPASAPADDGVEIQHGVKVIRLTPAPSSASVAIPVPGAPAVALRPAPDPRLVETTHLGALPRIGADGARPAAVYARPAPAPTGAPRVALVVADMGLDQGDTARLARRLPPAVTFAFPPEAPDLAAQVAETRAAGHEVVLQLTGTMHSPGEEALDDLHRAMTRAAGYAGVSLAPDARDAERTAVLRDLTRRGLYAVDPAPEASPGAEGVRNTDVAIPASGEGPALDRLAATARARGSAVGWVAGRGIDAEALAGWGGGGADLVPLSALADAGASPAR